MRIISLIIFITLSFYADAQELGNLPSGWEFVNERPGIKVFTRTPENSSIKELKILVDMIGDMDTLMNIVNDANGFQSWVYKCADSERVLPPEGFTSAYAATTDFPFPMSDRELVAKTKQWIDDDGKLHSHTVCAADAIPIKSGVVRIETYDAKWVVEKIDDSKIHIDYTSSVDPGGNIPTWMINMAITSGPIKTFEKLIKKVEGKCSFRTSSLTE